ncbi:LOW QUALITY PROTEIN: hypothetical protein U9M48_028914 [Paspalum notatum var. saurae]|uniref:Transposase-associated domain-containing protein n=1 Tax=Paspalum notatum var. saurae TaxID=547442 RepID=A0AAQ3TXS8_PASNO
MASRRNEEEGASCSTGAQQPPVIKMMDTRWIHATLFSLEYVTGVKSFMGFIRERFPEGAEIVCPCRRCLNQKNWSQEEVQKHILLYGMSSTYTRWIHHGEQSEVHVLEDPVQWNAVYENSSDGRFEDMLNDLYRSQKYDGNAGLAEDRDQAASQTGGNESVFAAIMEEAKRELYLGCTKLTRFSFVSYEEAKKVLREVGLGYISIHVCPNNCVPFRKRYEKYDTYPVCKASRWKDPERKKVPCKVLRHFPLAPRLQRFLSKNSQGCPDEKEMCHPADGDAWKDFDRCWPDFVVDPRNLRLGLATDGFNPFGNMSTSYSMWHVFIVPYNLPPWCCMEESNFMMALLILGPESPRKHFDVFMQPLVEDLLELWAGVYTKDAFTGQWFYLWAVVLWCIHNYSALGTMSGRTTKGYFACLHCDKDPLSYLIRNKICYIGHCRFLPDGSFTTEKVLAELEKVRVGQKRKRAEKIVPIWGRRVCLWDLPYWPHLKLRHNLDVTHIEKNANTESKDTINARLDLSDLNIKRELQLRENGNTFDVPKARYSLSKCINADGTKVHGLKTHDCHILTYINPFVSLEAFFGVMVHLTVHLPEEAILRGPVQFGWMYPIERRLLTLKRYVRNKARPEGSVAEAYVAEESLTFCSK